MKNLLYIMAAILMLVLAYQCCNYIDDDNGVINGADPEIGVSTRESEKPDIEQVPIELSYDIGDDKLLITLSGGSFPYTVRLVDANDSIITTIPDLNEGQSELLSNLGKLSEGKYVIRVEDASGEENSIELGINSLKNVKCVNDLSDEKMILAQVNNMIVDWFGYVSYLRGAKNKENSELRERTIGYAKELFIDSLRQIEIVLGARGKVKETYILHDYLKYIGINRRYPVVSIDISDLYIFEEWSYDKETQTLVAKAKFISHYQGFIEESAERDITTYEKTLVYSEENTKTVELQMRKIDCIDEKTNRIVYKGCCEILLGDFKTLK
jgi:hypothetical protein